MLVDVHPSRLESAPSHLHVEGKVPEAWVLRKLTITIHHQVLKVVSSSDGVVAWGNIVTRTSGEQRREGTRDISFSAELVDRSISTLGPRHNLLGVCRPSLSLLHCLPDCSFLRDLSGHDRNKSASIMGVVFQNIQSASAPPQFQYLYRASQLHRLQSCLHKD